MPEVLCISHEGIRCGILPRRILTAKDVSTAEFFVVLWTQRTPRRATANETELALRIVTADGPRWIRGSNALLMSIPQSSVSPIPPRLREVLRPHVVGLAEVDSQLVWLVNPTRFNPPETDC